MSGRLSYALGLLLKALLLLPISHALAADEGGPERIDHFDITLKVEPSGDLLITERLQVTANGEQIRHGIFRDIPTTYSLPGGLLRKTPITLLSVRRDGHDEPYQREQISNGVRYRLGSAEVFIEPGQHLYELQYRMDAQLYFSADKDQLYWNLTGNQWQFPIYQATATIELPQGARIQQMTGYTGYSGNSSGRAYQVLSQDGNVLKLATTQPLAAEEGFTVALDWQAGLVKRPNAFQRGVRLLWDNLNILVGILAVLGLFVYYYRSWLQVGRDPAKGVIIPRYEAPNEVSPARAGYVWNQGFSSDFSDVEAFTVTITDLARRKALSIADAPKSTAFILSKGELDEGAQAHERALFGHLFTGASEIRVGNKYLAALNDALSAHSEKLSEWGDKLFSKNRKPWYLGMLGALLAFGAMGLLGDPVMLFALFPIIFVAVGAGLMMFGWRTITGNQRSFVGIVPILFGLPFALGGLGTAVAMLNNTSPYVAGCVLLIVLMIWLFRGWLEAPSVEGRATLDGLEGYRDYLQLAESDSLARAADAPAMSIALYERHLPYAMALGVEQQWTARLGAAIQSGVVQWSEPTYQPEWYRNSSRFSTPSAFSSALVAAASSASTPPPSPSSSSGSSSSSSSSSSGGGSSGGGGGGGGGGGW
ncbi:putative membrane protein YgcG [Pseudomonas sp. TE3786]